MSTPNQSTLSFLKQLLADGDMADAHQALLDLREHYHENDAGMLEDVALKMGDKMSSASVLEAVASLQPSD